MNPNRSRSAITQTPADWQHVQIVKVEPGEGFQFDPFYRLATGIFDSIIGWQTCKAAGIENADALQLSEALTAGAKLEAWLAKQNPKQEKKK